MQVKCGKVSIDLMSMDRRPQLLAKGLSLTFNPFASLWLKPFLDASGRHHKCFLNFGSRLHSARGLTEGQEGHLDKWGPSRFTDTAGR